MKSILYFAFLFTFFSLHLQGQSKDLFFSKYLEGTANNKALEIYNPLLYSINLADSNYTIAIYFNGSRNASVKIKLTGTLHSGNVHLVAHANAEFLTINGGIIIANQLIGQNLFNGDDAIVLQKGNGEVVDVIGQRGLDPGTAWGTGNISTIDNFLIRKNNICQGTTIDSASFDPTSQWEGVALNDVAKFGSHSANCLSSTPKLFANVNQINIKAIAGNASVAQKFYLQALNIISNVDVLVPPDFAIALNENGPFSKKLEIKKEAFPSNGILIFIKYIPSLAGSENGILNASASNTNLIIPLNGIAYTNNIISIPAIQGITDSSSYSGSLVITEGAVTAIYQGNNELGGYFLQDTMGDFNDSSSDGIFVYNISYPVNIGDYIQLHGEVAEFNGRTEIKNLTSFLLLKSKVKIPYVIQCKFPISSLLYLESKEGMMVNFTDTMTVTDTYTLARYGEVGLSAIGVLRQPTEMIDPNDFIPSDNSFTGNANIAEIKAMDALNANNSIMLDDGSTLQNNPRIPFVDPTDSTLRLGSTMHNLKGIIDYSFGAFRIHPTMPIAINYNARPLKPVLRGNLKIASFNMLNYFNGNGRGGGFPTARGANNFTEFNRQKIKLVKALNEIDADITGLMEVENDGESDTSAIHDIVNELKDLSGKSFKFVHSPWNKDFKLGSDAIKVAFIYNSKNIMPIGISYADTGSIHNRPPLAQLFRSNLNGEEFIVVVNHFKSKGCADASGADRDLKDGQGCYNDRRKRQSFALLQFVDSLKVKLNCNKVVLIGDFNAYAQEDPIDFIRSRGYENSKEKNFSYAFDGMVGTLDHIFISKSFTDYKETFIWNINADEPMCKDYNTEYNPPGYYKGDVFRSSDHNPTIAVFDQTIEGVYNESLLHGPKIWPSPSTGCFNLQWEGHYLKYEVFELYDVFGKKIHGLPIRYVAADQVQFSSDALKSGIYYVKIQNKLAETITLKVIIHD